MPSKTYHINLAEIPSNKGVAVIVDGDNKEYISFNGIQSPIMDKKGNVIKSGKLLNVKRYV